jgi:hypothetical protein
MDMLLLLLLLLLLRQEAKLRDRSLLGCFFQPHVRLLLIDTID